LGDIFGGLAGGVVDGIGGIAGGIADALGGIVGGLGDIIGGTARCISNPSRCVKKNVGGIDVLVEIDQNGEEVKPEASGESQEA
jgi:hypothetical protein